MRRVAENMAIVPCHGCRALTRPQKTRLADYPGTVLRQGRNQCDTCYHRRKRGDTRATPEEKRRIKEALHDNNIRGLANFLVARNERKGVKF